jgi:hypothetical protein
MSDIEGQSDIKKLNSTGERTEPCGITNLRIFGLEVAEP